LTTEPEKPAVPKPLTRGEIAGRLRHRVEEATPGTVAELRRAGAGEPSGAFFRLATDLLDAGTGARSGPLRDRGERGWAAFASLLARARTLTSGPSLGHALAAAGIAEGRVLRLLQTHDEALFDAARGVVHQLVSKGQPFDAIQLAHLLLSDGASDEDEKRRVVARDFYRHHAS
jgi:CRISPR type I-E-associated protein CasB/Cse2